MRIVRYHTFGEPEVLRVEEAPTPAPGAGQALVRAEAIGVNFVTTLARRDRAPWPSTVPASPGGDVLGTVEAVGDGVTSVAVGNRVVTAVGQDAYADAVVADAAALTPVPVGVDAALASVLASPAQVALGAIRSARLGAGETILITAAAGTIGHLALQLARVEGAATVIGAAGSPAKLDFIRSYGADVAVDYGDEGWAARVRDATGGRGVDVVLDSVGGELLEPALDLLVPFGRLVMYGVAGGIARVPAMRVFGLRSMTGFDFSTYREHRPDAARRNREELVAHAAAGRLHSALHATVPLAEAPRAHAIVEAREQLGRVLLVP